MTANDFSVEVKGLEMTTDRLHAGDPVLLTMKQDYLSGDVWWHAECDLGFLGYVKGDDAKRLAFRAQAQGNPRATISEIDPGVLLAISFHETAPQYAGASPQGGSTAGLMVGGFVRGIVARIAQFAGLAFLLIWIFSGFYNSATLVLAIGLFIGGSFLAYVSRQTMKTR
jgi:hypothetical protein